ncbi:MAG TPA: DUF2939 domain-containing protein [Paraburkholderia sp.]|jgi:hypothetical protein|nr:DUF2939 domain-containing protein [Paraburkholderia sp.]
MAVSTPAKRGFTRPLIIALVVIAIVAVLGYSYASPYLALDRLKRAADARDVATVNEYVDYPALRESLKEEIAGLLTRRVRASGNPFAAIGAMIGAALIGPMVDAYATPDGVAALLNGMPPRGNPTDRPPAPQATASNAPAAPTDSTPGAAAPAPAPQAETPPQPPQTTAGYHGINEFVVTYQHGVGDTRYSAILRRDGLFSWKLAAVDLNG